MKTINADELIKALEADHETAMQQIKSAATNTERKELEGYLDGLDIALWYARELAKQADNVGELPY